MKKERKDIKQLRAKVIDYRDYKTNPVLMLESDFLFSIKIKK